jgi:hypothetical protein
VQVGGGGSVVLDALVEQLSEWARDVKRDRAAAQDRASAAADQQAAQVLRDATYLIALMQEYDNSARRAYREAFMYASQEPVADEDPAIKGDRRKAYDNLRVFDYGQELRRAATRVLGPLRDRPAPLDDVTAEGSVAALVRCGQEFLRLANDVRNAKQMYDGEAAYGYGSADFMRSMANGSVSEVVARYATRMIERTEPLSTVLDRADSAYGDLCTALRQAHHLPELPPLGS